MPARNLYRMKEVIELSLWKDLDTPDVIFVGKRSRERRDKQAILILEVLRNVDPRRPTRDHLQKLAGIRRSLFIKVLKRLIEKGDVFRYGRGVKDDPFTYGIPLPG